ncbi:lipopolysaccharide biosynthesis protein [Desertivirga xinjiangensis]|uniref:lipopolysaccharide biosynthesis protein n=1 Tax=Desertivirga xinjiangensis TaxID=539206 RepID=UPI00210BACD6|nr:lipopolysaccharide biosynthesis protein [Pedobacter xinjiangensis]
MTENPSFEDEISLKNILLGLRRWIQFLMSRFVTLLIVGLVGSLIGFVYAYTKKIKYVAEFSFALEDEKSSGGIGAYAALAGQFGLSMGGSGGGAFTGDNLLELMRSRKMVEKALLTSFEINGQLTTLAEYYITFNELREGWGKKKPELLNIHFHPNANRKTFNLSQDSLLGVFYKALIKDGLEVGKVDKKLSIILVKVRSENELFSKYFTEALVNNVADFYIQTKTKKSVQNLTILQHQTDSIRMQLNAAISGVAASVDVNPNQNLAKQVLRVPSQRRAVDVQANTAILSELVKNLEISKVSLRRETPLIQVIDTPILPLEKEKTSKLKSMILGGFISSIIAVTFLILQRIYRDILNK